MEEHTLQGRQTEEGEPPLNHQARSGDNCTHIILKFFYSSQKNRSISARTGADWVDISETSVELEENIQENKEVSGNMKYLALSECGLCEVEQPRYSRWWFEACTTVSALWSSWLN
ncbi:hypothetical protein C2S51_030746 [Perilla frutescens var. frutescens]|nr:hypothetical protein C2S51_030746 [Perilla frutescens var. frutescens]